MPSHRRHRRKKRNVLPALSAITLLAAGFLYWSNTALQVTRFDPVFSQLPQGFSGCRIVVLSDTQSMHFGKEQSRLLQTVAAQNPDYIFFLGDMTDRFRDVPERYVETLAGGKKI